MAEDFKLDENGINPVHSDSGKKDVYFSNQDYSRIKADGRPVRQKGGAHTAASKSGGVVSTYLFFIIVIAVSMLLSVYAIFCLNDVFGITKTKSSVTVSYAEEIKSTNDAVDLLADNDLIKCRLFCKTYLKLADAFVGHYDVTGPYQAGVYYLNGKMGLEGMLINMMGDPETSETVRITIPEGYTVADIIDKLVDNEVCDKAALLSVIESTEFSYSLVSSRKASETVPYRLEGYLFPDTYDFYVGQSASSAIETFLKNTESKITEEDRKRASELGFTMDEIMIIASIIQAEAGSTEQMKDIAAVIENRLKDTTNYPSLGCLSTSDYINNKVAPALSSTSAHTPDYYLKYYSTESSSTVVGLPEGPICNPGHDAIEAALNPSDINAYFFFHNSERELFTAETYSEFKSLIRQHAPYLNY